MVTIGHRGTKSQYPREGENHGPRHSILKKKEGGERQQRREYRGEDWRSRAVKTKGGKLKDWKKTPTSRSPEKVRVNSKEWWAHHNRSKERGNLVRGKDKVLDYCGGGSLNRSERKGATASWQLVGAEFLGWKRNHLVEGKVNVNLIERVARRPHAPQSKSSGSNSFEQKKGELAIATEKGGVGHWKSQGRETPDLLKSAQAGSNPLQSDLGLKRRVPQHKERHSHGRSK